VREAIMPSQAIDISWNMMARKVSMSKTEFENHFRSYKDAKAIFFVGSLISFCARRA
jgi:hypothetical protein